MPVISLMAPPLAKGPGEGAIAAATARAAAAGSGAPFVSTEGAAATSSPGAASGCVSVIPVASSFSQIKSKLANCNFFD